MQKFISRVSLLAAAGMLACAASVHATTVATDIFDNHTDVTTPASTIAAGPDTGNPSYVAGGAVLTVANDATFGSKAITDTAPATGSGEWMALLPVSASMTSPGDTITVTFAYHFTTAPSGTARAIGLNFGLYKSNGTTTDPANYATSTNDDQGYWGAVSYAATGSTGPYPNSIAEEKGGAAPLMGGSPTDSVTLASFNAGAGSSVTDANIYKVTFKLTMLNGGGTSGNNKIQLDLSETDNSNVSKFALQGFDDGTNNSASTADANQTVVPFTSFNELAFRTQTFGTVVDNIVIDASNVPEPASLGLLALGGLGLLRRRAR